MNRPFDLNAYLRNDANCRTGYPRTYPGDHPHMAYRQVNRVVCKDGFSISVQASHTHYCTPRNSLGPWTHVELGYPQMGNTPVTLPEQFAEHSDGDPDQIEGVWGYVPIELVEQLIADHGGTKS